ncbi:unnamed protein product [Paramecium sonneborni]|uniref:Uncharacterized protein n=1 Tax=Paramecium sonneborni TaxID=65129 RepID=A0A8S1RSJ3_9CILI|nr:unnamed protein product [Paramecium sonneborni]
MLSKFINIIRKTLFSIHLKLFIICQYISLVLKVNSSDLRKHKDQGYLLIGGNFFGCNFNGSEFDSIDISGLNLNGCLLINCKQKNIKIHELNELEGHEAFVNQVCFSPDGATILQWKFFRSSSDNSMVIHIQSCQSVSLLMVILYKFMGSQKRIIKNQFVQSTSLFLFQLRLFLYYPCIRQFDKSIRLWDFKTGIRKSFQQVKCKLHILVDDIFCIFTSGYHNLRFLISIYHCNIQNHL